MESFYLKNTKDLKKEKKEIEDKIGISIEIKGKNAIISGEPFQEYEASLVLEAMQFGFSAKTALTLLNEDIIFRKIPIKSFTRRKDMKEVRGRVIGKYGKTKQTIETISGCDLIINEEENQIGIIGSTEEIEEASTALQKLIKGSKQANVYRFLERMNAGKKSISEDLGLKIKKG